MLNGTKTCCFCCLNAKLKLLRFIPSTDVKGDGTGTCTGVMSHDDHMTQKVACLSYVRRAAHFVCFNCGLAKTANRSTP